MQLFFSMDWSTFDNVWFWAFVLFQWIYFMFWPLGIFVDRMNDAVLMRVRTRASQVTAPLSISAQLAWGLYFFCLMLVAALGVGSQIELAQGILVLLLPIALIAWVQRGSARRILRSADEDVTRILQRLQLKIQCLGAVIIFIAAFWGMILELR